MGKQLKDPKTVTINGKRYKIERQSNIRVDGDKVWGYCENGRVVIDSEADGPTLLNVLIHEAGIHGFFDYYDKRRPPFLHEDTVDKLANDLACLLWRFGYRRIGEDERDDS